MTTAGQSGRRYPSQADYAPTGTRSPCNHGGRTRFFRVVQVGPRPAGRPACDDEARRIRRDTVMPMSHDVSLPRDRVPVFPPRCVACGGRPGATVRVSARSIGWWTLVLLTNGRRVRADVPACRACAGRFRRERVVRLLADAAVVGGGAGVAVWLLGWYRGPFRKHLLVAMAVACCLPAVVWEVFRPPAVGLTARSDTVDYEFRDRGYADDFAAVNGGTVT